MDQLEFKCPWCGSIIDVPRDMEPDIWKEGGHDVECPECGMLLAINTERPVVFHVGAFFDEMRLCVEGECGFYGIGCCTAGTLDASPEARNGVPAWCPRL